MRQKSTDIQQPSVNIAKAGNVDVGSIPDTSLPAPDSPVLLGQTAGRSEGGSQLYLPKDTGPSLFGRGRLSIILHADLNSAAGLLFFLTE
jgi:hypothetical protein